MNDYQTKYEAALGAMLVRFNELEVKFSVIVKRDLRSSAPHICIPAMLGTFGTSRRWRSPTSRCGGRSWIMLGCGVSMLAGTGCPIQANELQSLRYSQITRPG